MAKTPERGTRRTEVYLLALFLVLALCGVVRAATDATPAEPTDKGRTAAEWIEIMGGEDGGLVTGVAALKRIGAPALPLLLRTVREHPKDKVRCGVAQALGEIGGPAVPAALRAVISEEPRSDVGFYASSALAKLIEKGDTQATAERPAAIAALRAAAAEPAPAGRNAAGALAKLGPEGRDVLLSVLGAAQDPSVRRNAVSALAVADGQGVVEALIRSLADADVAVRRASAAAMGSRFRDDAPGETPSAAVSALSRALQDPNLFVRWAAADALKRIGPGAREALPALRAACRDADTNVSKAARGAVGALEAIPSTVVIDTPPTTPSAAAGTVHRGRTLGEWAQAFLSSNAASEDEARRVLNEVGAAAFPVLQAIAQSAADRNVRRRALGYIGSKGGHGAAEVIEAFLRTDPDGGIRATAAAALADLANRGDVDAGRRVEGIIPEMIESLGKDPAATGVPVTSLSRIGALAVPALEKAAKGHASANVREGAVHCLKQSQNAKVASTLIHALKDRSPAVRLAVINAIPWIVGASSPWIAEAVAGLAAALKDPDSDVKKAAARTLGSMGPPARGALGALHAAAENDPSMRNVVESAIRELE